VVLCMSDGDSRDVKAQKEMTPDLFVYCVVDGAPLLSSKSHSRAFPSTSKRIICLLSATGRYVNAGP